MPALYFVAIKRRSTKLHSGYPSASLFLSDSNDAGITKYEWPTGVGCIPRWDSIFHLGGAEREQPPLLFIFFSASPPFFSPHH